MTRVLIADDSETVIAMMRMRLEMADYEVLTAVDGVEVVEMLTGDDPVEPDVILLDAMMPRMSGVDALRKLRDQGIKTPIVMISAHLAASSADEMAGHGADATVPKPFDWDELMSQIDKLAKKGAKRKKG